MELKLRKKGFCRKLSRKAKMKLCKILIILIQMQWHMNSSFNLKKETEKSIKGLHHIKLVKLKRNNGWKKEIPMNILAQFVLIFSKDYKCSRSCKSAAMSIILSALINGLKMKKDALFVTRNYYDSKFFHFKLHHDWLKKLEFKWKNFIYKEFEFNNNILFEC
jgi:hypothetical protein